MKDVIFISKNEFMDLCSKVICDTIMDFKEKSETKGEEIILMLVGTLISANLRKELFKEGE